MRDVPRSALILGLLGLIPFVFGALVSSGVFWANMGDPANGGYPLIVAQDGDLILIRYGTVILSFMSGVLWGFATRGEGPLQATGYALSVIPALWAFFMVSGGPAAMAANLIFGFVGLLALDWHFWRNGMAPPWWMNLRVLLTFIVVLCLLTVVF